MRNNRTDGRGILTRREALTAAAAIGGGLALGRNGSAGANEQTAQPGAKVCLLTPEAVQGPFYFDPKLVRAEITEGKLGAPLALTLQVVEAKDCAPLVGARVDVWHADALGAYSGFARQETGSTQGETFLRGTQFTSPGGEVRFATIYPGWYPTSGTSSPASSIFRSPSPSTSTP
jgi:protocatechuate 3,4-dioxygenase beta subunit